MSLLPVDDAAFRRRVVAPPRTLSAEERARVDVEAARALAVPSHHGRGSGWVDNAVVREEEMDALAEQIRAVEDELVFLRSEYKRLEAWQPEPAGPRVTDFRGVSSAGVDDRAEWLDAG